MKRILSLALCLCLLPTLLLLAGCKPTVNEDPDTKPIGGLTDPALTQGSQGLEYTLNPQGQYYTVTGMGTCTDTVVKIPQVYNGRPVRAIADGAFRPQTTVVAAKDGFTLLDAVDEPAATPEENITEVVIPDSITDIGDEAFKGCENLEEIEISNLVSLIGTDAFKDTAFYLDESNWEGDVLYLREYLVNVREGISGTLTVKEGIKHIADGALRGCNGITEVILPDSMRVIGKETFKDCIGLAEINLNIAGLYISDEAFAGCTALTAISLGNDLAPTWVDPETLPTYTRESSLGDDVIMWGGGTISMYHDKSALNYGEDGFIFSTMVGNKAFENCTALSSITFGANVRYLGTAAFCGCTALTAVDMSNLTAVAENEAMITPYGVTLAETCLDRLFENCTALTTVTFPQNIRLLMGTFRGCTALTAITVPDTVAQMRDTFADCTALASVTLSRSLVLMGATFRGCTALTTVALPDTLEIVGSDTFRECTSLTAITLPDRVRRVWGNAFLEASPDAVVSIGTTVNYIGDSAFAYLHELQYRGTKAQWNAITLTSEFAGGSAHYTVVHCTDGDVIYGTPPQAE